MGNAAGAFVEEFSSLVGVSVSQAAFLFAHVLQAFATALCLRWGGFDEHTRGGVGLLLQCAAALAINTIAYQKKTLHEWHQVLHQLPTGYS